MFNKQISALFVSVIYSYPVLWKLKKKKDNLVFDEDKV